MYHAGTWSRHHREYIFIVYVKAVVYSEAAGYWTYSKVWFKCLVQFLGYIFMKYLSYIQLYRCGDDYSWKQSQRFEAVRE